MSILGSETKGEKISYYVAVNEEYEFANEFDSIEECLEEIKDLANYGEYDGDIVEIIELGEYYDGEEENVLYRAVYNYDEEKEKSVPTIEFIDEEKISLTD